MKVNKVKFTEDLSSEELDRQNEINYKKLDSLVDDIIDYKTEIKNKIYYGGTKESLEEAKENFKNACKEALEVVDKIIYLEPLPWED